MKKAWRDLRYEPTATPGVDVAKCEWCGIAWVRAGGGPGRLPLTIRHGVT